MKFRINNMLKVREGEIVLAPGKITTIVGDHASGKTSIAVLIGAILAQNENPFSASKAHGKIYLHDESDSGNIEQYDDNDEPVCRWDAVSGELDVFSVGDEEETSTVSSSLGAVGLVEFCAGTMPEAARVALWEKYFLPPIEVLREKLKQQLTKHLKKTTLEDVLDLIDQGDLKKIVSAYEIRRKKAKSAWMGITGQNWGAKQAADWIPEGWTAELDGLDQNDVNNTLEVARDELRSLQVKHTISVSELQQALVAKANAEIVQHEGLALKTKIEKLEEEIKETSRPLVVANKEMSDVEKLMYSHNQKKPYELKSLKCGACGAQLLSMPDENGVFQVYDEDQYLKDFGKWEDKNEKLLKELAHRKDKIEEHKEKITPLQETHFKLSNEIQELRGKCRALLEVSKDADKEAGEIDHEATEDAERAIVQSVRNVELVDKRMSAHSHHEDVLAYNAIIQALGPKGVRSTMMKEAMDEFTISVNRVHAVTGWPLVELDAGYSVSIGGRKILRVCAASERLRTQYTIQLAIALSQGEPVVILDEVDTLLPLQQEMLIQLLGMICRRPDSPAFLLCGADGHFHVPGLMDTPYYYRSYEVVDGVVNEVVQGD